jgi:hypothetical protein
MADAAMIDGATQIEPAEARVSSEGDLREHEASVRRLRRVLGIGVVLWNVIGIPNDATVTETFGLSYREFLWARVLSTVLVVGGWLVFWTKPGPRVFRAAEATAFFGASMGLAGLQHGLLGPTPIFLSCTLLAQGIAVPRPWREGVVSLGLTWLGYPLGTLVLVMLTDRSASEWHDPAHVVAFAVHLFLAAATAAFAVIGGDAFHALRLRAREAQRVGSYRLRSRLGGGATGDVWRAHHPGLDQDVAVKLARGVDAAARLGEEAELLASVSHPNVVRLLDRGRTEARSPFYAMALVEGETLQARIERDGPVDAALARTIGQSLARGLAAVHQAGIVHRDVKPANVILRPDEHAGVATLVDFGAATRTTDRIDRPIGSPRFMAPEQRLGVVDPRADVFACAAVVFFALTGKSPLDTDGEPSALAIAPALDALVVDEPLRTALRAALAIDPDARTADAAALRDALAG